MEEGGGVGTKNHIQKDGILINLLMLEAVALRQEFAQMVLEMGGVWRVSF